MEKCEFLVVNWFLKIAVIADLYACAFYDCLHNDDRSPRILLLSLSSHGMHAAARVTRGVPPLRRQILFVVTLSMYLIYISHPARTIMLHAAFR